MIGIGDYPGVSRAQMALARNYSSLLLIGPPVCDELLALVEHMYTEEEADIVQHLKPWRPRTAASLASKTGRPLPEVEAVLSWLAHDKQVILSFKAGGKERYTILPMVPGTFEMVLVRTSKDSLNPWHQRFAELHEALFKTGFSVDYFKKPVHPVRYLPVGEVIQAQPAALPSDRLDVILERYDRFAVGLCQCRLLHDLTGDGCGRMLETCTVVGEWAPVLVSEGKMRQASREEVLEIKAAAEREGLVTWMVNEESGRYTSSLCSCCGCCCGALRTVTEFNVPGFIAPPHFMPAIDRDACTCCGECVKACPMKALTVKGEGEDERLEHAVGRCIGCGLCSVACPSEAQALTMNEVPKYREPPGSWASYIARYFPNLTLNILKTWSSRRRGPTRA